MGEVGIEEGGSETLAATEDGQRFLTQARIREIGGLVAPLIGDGLTWAERRKESVQILDDTALRRQISVDFSLRRFVKPLLTADTTNDPLYCAPIFVLPKSPSNLRSFDLCDEDGHALSLISREDNARISGEVLVALVKEHAGLEPGAELPQNLQEELRRMTSLEAERAEPIAKRLIAAGGPWGTELMAVREDERLRGWLLTLSHSSIVVVLFRSIGPRRKLVKLTFEEAINTKQRLSTRLGWAPYEVMIDSPRIEARSFHFEAEAPSGLRISEAKLTDSEHDGAITERGFMKRVHLYRQSSERAGAGTAVLSLDVAGQGFVSGAMLASVLTVGALLACAIRASSIAANPTSAPALLLVLPGLIASYVARPDRHALTTRLLSFARVLLLGIAFCAYVAAARVGLGGAHTTSDPTSPSPDGSLETWLWVLMIIATVLFLALAVTWVRGAGLLQRLSSEHRFACNETVEMDPERLKTAMQSPVYECPLPGNYTHREAMYDGVLELNRSAWHGEWTLTLSIEAIADCSLVSATLDYVKLVPAGVLSSRDRKTEAEQVRSYLSTLATWAQQQ